MRASLDWDALLPGEIVAGHRTTENVSKEFVEQISSYASKFQALQDLKQVDQKERDALTDLLSPSSSPSVAPERSPASENPRPWARTRVRPHPVERTIWYRFGRITWWAVFGLWATIFGLAFLPSQGGAWIISVGVGAAVLMAIKAGVFYVALGRITLWEPKGSGFVDLDELAQELFEQSPDNNVVSELAELRARYGRRAPRDVALRWSEQRIADSLQKKRTVLAELDKKRATVNLESFRKDVLSSPSCENSDVRAMLERQFAEWALEYGQEVPASVASEVADSWDPDLAEYNRRLS